MKKIFKYLFVAFASVSLLSCDGMFDKIEGDLRKMSAEDMLGSEAGIKSILANLYGDLPINSFSTGDQKTMMAAASRQAQSIDVSGVSSFWDYTKIRSINKFIEALDNAAAKGILSEATAQAYRGEALFIRAYCYFASARVYGGIPIITESLDAAYDGKENEGLYFPRKTEKETWDWLLTELEQAANLLPEFQTEEMRVNRYTALGLKTRVALWAASESKYWNNAAINSGYEAVKKKLTYMEASYANEYYKQAIDAAEKIIKAKKYALYGAEPSSVDDAVSNLEDLFQEYRTTEGMLGRSYVSGSATSSNGIESSWFPCNVYLSGSYSITLNGADAFDDYASPTNRTRVHTGVSTRVDGDETRFVTTPEDNLTYEDIAQYKHYATLDGPFKNKDARFQAWIVYPGSFFRGHISYFQGGMILPDKSVSVYPANNDGVSFGGQTYYPYGGPGDILENNYGFYKIATDLNDNKRNEYGFFIRKYLDPKEWNQYNQAPWYDMRYAEILLSYAEAVAESGQGDKELAANCLNDVRRRAGFTDKVALSLENVLHEFQVEFAFEDVWPQVLYRRRAFYNPDSHTGLEGDTGKKLALVPLLDLSGTEPSYIFVRAIPYTSDPKRYTGTLQVKAEDYYKSIPNYTNNRIEDNNK